MQKQRANTSNQEPFDLSIWIANKLGLDTLITEEKSRLDELILAFRKAGFRTRELVESIDNESIDAINSELTEGNKLKLGEKRALKGIVQ